MAEAEVVATSQINMPGEGGRPIIYDPEGNPQLHRNQNRKRFWLAGVVVIVLVAAIAISLPVALVIAPYLGVAGDVILFASLVVAGMPFLFLVGAAPNAIAYDSKQFSTGEFFMYGIPASILLMVVTGFAVYVLWPIMGMQITTPVQ